MSNMMTTQKTTRLPARQLALLRIVGMACVCGVAWALVVSPQSRAVEAREHAIEQTQARIASGATDSNSGPDAVADLERLNAAAKALSEFGANTNDPQTLYNAYRHLAEDCSIRVDRVEPRSLESNSGHNSVRTVVYTVDVAGTYEGVARMLHAIQTRMGPTRVRAFRMTPAAKPGADAGSTHDWLVATIETVHVELALPPNVVDAAKHANSTINQDGGAS